MVYAKKDPNVLGFLGRALSLEMTAVQQYLTLSRLLQLRGFSEIAQTFQQEAQEEMTHVERIISRMLVLGVAPSATQLRPPVLGDSLPLLVSNTQKFEEELVNFYQQAVNYCTHIDDFDNRLFFEKLLQEEKQHAMSLGNWQNELAGN